MNQPLHASEPSGQAPLSVAVGQKVAGLRASDQELSSIRESLQGLRYGSVHITVHDGMVVQIDRTEKHRFRGQSASAQ